jgi:hypothetical protein
VIENFIGTKSRKKILEGLKRKVNIFIGTKNIFNPKNYRYKLRNPSRTIYKLNIETPLIYILRTYIHSLVLYF